MNRKFSKPFELGDLLILQGKNLWKELLTHPDSLVHTEKKQAGHWGGSNAKGSQDMVLDPKELTSKSEKGDKSGLKVLCQLHHLHGHSNLKGSPPPSPYSTH